MFKGSVSEEVIGAAKAICGSGVLRIAVKGNGCSGISFSSSKEDAPEEGDDVFEVDGRPLFVSDPFSSVYLESAEIDVAENALRVMSVSVPMMCGCPSSF